MTNLVKMDLYRMFKSKAIWIILAIAMLMMLASAFMTHSDVVYYMNNPIALENLKISYKEVNWGVYIGSVSPDWCTGAKIPLGDLITVNIQSNILLMFLVVFTVTFVSEESRTGFIKNIAGYVQNRGMLVLSKMISVAVFAAMLLISACIVIMLGCKLFFGYIDFEGLNNFISFFGIELILHVAFGAVIICLVTVLKSPVASIMTGILLSAGILQIIDTIIGAFIGNMSLPRNFSIMYYTVSGNIKKMTIYNNFQGYIRALIIGFVFMVFSMGISMYITQKRDVE